jgi:K+-sensing histidine kinase KdpD
VAKRELFDPCGIKSFIAVALKAQEKELGVLYVGSKKPHEANEEELKTMQIFGYQATTRIMIHEAVENEKRAFRAERLAEIAAMAAQFAHRLGNTAGTTKPLVKEISEKLKAKGINDPSIFEALNTIGTNTEALLTMANQLGLGDYAAELVSLDVSWIVEQAIEDTKLEATEVTIEKNIATTRPITGIKVFLIDAIKNILQNAVQAKAKYIRIDAVDRADVIDLAISDDGEGLAKEEKSKIFLPLYSSQKTGDSKNLHGLGLWASKVLIATLMRGNLSVESEGKGKGSRFVLTFQVF